MKKILILLCAIFMLTSSAAFAYSDHEKKLFYDGFIQGFFGELPDSLVKNGHNRAKAQKYTVALQARLNRQQLEQQTWSCISRYSIEEMNARQKELGIICFGPWVTKFLEKNADLQQLLR